MEIETGRLMHGMRVAEKMKKAVENNPSLCNADADEAFLLGYIHDVGYNFVDKQDEHEHYAGELLKKQGYKFWREVYYHGTPECEYGSDELNLLNWADMTVDQTGTDVTLAERLEDIGKRYGKDSSQYIKAVQLSKEISLWMEQVGIQ